MKTYRLQKAPVLNDGTQGEWETSLVGGKPEIWHDYDKALSSSEKRDMLESDMCYWRVEGDQTW